MPYGNIINTNNIATLNKRISDIVRSFKSLHVSLHSTEYSSCIEVRKLGTLYSALVRANLLSYPGTFEITGKLLAYESL